MRKIDWQANFQIDRHLPNRIEKSTAMIGLNIIFTPKQLAAHGVRIATLKADGVRLILKPPTMFFGMNSDEENGWLYDVMANGPANEFEIEAEVYSDSGPVMVGIFGTGEIIE